MTNPLRRIQLNTLPKEVMKMIVNNLSLQLSGSYVDKFRVARRLLKCAFYLLLNSEVELVLEEVDVSTK